MTELSREEVLRVARDAGIDAGEALYGMGVVEELEQFAAAIHESAYAKGAEDMSGDLLEWAVSRWVAEVSNRPLINIHRRSLDDTWRQLIRKLGGDPVQLCGPDHSSLLGALPITTTNTEGEQG